MSITSKFDLINQVSSTNRIDSLSLGIYAGEKDTDYILRLKVINMESIYRNLFLLDLKTGIKSIIANNELIYQFKTTPEEKTVNRFKIIAVSDVVNQEIKDIYVYVDKSYLYVDNKNESSGRLSIFDISGKQVGFYYFPKNTKTSYFLKIPNGVYIIKTDCDRQVNTFKIIISGN